LTTYVYTRVSTDTQDLESQKRGIQEYCSRNDIFVDEWLAVKISSKRTRQERRVAELLGRLKRGDCVVVSELSRLGRSLTEIFSVVQTLTQKKAALMSIKENISLNGKPNIQTKVMITMFGLFAELERDLISQRTREGLAAARARGVRLGNPNLHADNAIRREKASAFAERQRVLLEGFILRGMTQREIVEELNKLDIKARRGGSWTLAQLQHVLKRLGLKTVRAKS
jgi:DNA invertase Pin-like site-specific DNA recombinase